MANWKKVIVSGSNAHLNHITASGNISASGKLFGNLPESELSEVVIYNTATGRLEFKTLNLVSTRRAAGLYLADMNTDFSQPFKLSYDTGSTISGPTAYYNLSASIDDGSSYTVNTANNIDWVGINDTWNLREPANQAYYEGGGLITNITASISGSRQALNVGGDKPNVVLTLQAIDNTVTATPEYDTTQAPNLNYFAKSFNLPQSGTLEVYVNDNDTPVISQTLTGNGGVIATTSDNVTLNLSAVRFNSQSDQTGDDTKAARSGSVTIATAKQRDGYNFAYLIHKPGGDASPSHRITNFNEWFYDTAGAGTAMTTADSGIISNPSFDMTETASISGIKFFNTSQAGATLTYGAKINNQYRNVYPTAGGIQINDITGDTVSSVTINQNGTYQVATTNPTQNVAGDDSDDLTFDLAELNGNASAYSTDTKITSSFAISFNPESGDQQFYQPSGFIDSFADSNSGTDISSADNIISFTPKFTHITSHKSDLTLSEVTVGDYMLNHMTLTDSTERNFENFKGEQYRLESRSYAVGDTASISSYAWDGEKNVVNGGAGYNKGAIQYYSHLLYPTAAGVGGEFDVTLGPTGSGVQPTNYGTATANGDREYYRYFKMNSSDAGSKQVTIELLGNGKIVQDAHTTHFNGGDNDAIKVQAWRSQIIGNTTLYTGTFLNVLDSGIRIGSTVSNTAYLDIATSVANIEYTTNTGVIKIEDPDGGTFSENDFLIIRIIVPEDWKGNLDAMSVRTGTSQATLLGTTGFTNL